MKAATEVLEMGERLAEQCGSGYMRFVLQLSHGTVLLLLLV